MDISIEEIEHDTVKKKDTAMVMVIQTTVIESLNLHTIVKKDLVIPI